MHTTPAGSRALHLRHQKSISCVFPLWFFFNRASSYTCTAGSTEFYGVQVSAWQHCCVASGEKMRFFHPYFMTIFGPICRAYFYACTQDLVLRTTRMRKSNHTSESKLRGAVAVCIFSNKMDKHAHTHTHTPHTHAPNTDEEPPAWRVLKSRVQGERMTCWGVYGGRVVVNHLGY